MEGRRDGGQAGRREGWRKELPRFSPQHFVQHPRALLDQRLEAVALNPYNHKVRTLLVSDYFEFGAPK